MLVQLVCISVCVYQWSSLVAVCVLVVHARILDCNAHRVEDRKLRHVSASAFVARVDLAVLSPRMRGFSQQHKYLAVLSPRMRGPSSRPAVLMRFESRLRLDCYAYGTYTSGHAVFMGLVRHALSAFETRATTAVV